MSSGVISIDTLDFLAKVDATIMRVEQYASVAYPLEWQKPKRLRLPGLGRADEFLCADSTFEEEPTLSFNRIIGLHTMLSGMKSELGNDVRFKMREVAVVSPSGVASAVYGCVGTLNANSGLQFNRRLLDKVAESVPTMGLPMWAQCTYNPAEFAMDFGNIKPAYR